MPQDKTFADQAFDDAAGITHGRLLLALATQLPGGLIKRHLENILPGVGDSLDALTRQGFLREGNDIHRLVGQYRRLLGMERTAQESKVLLPTLLMQQIWAEWSRSVVERSSANEACRPSSMATLAAEQVNLGSLISLASAGCELPWSDVADAVARFYELLITASVPIHWEGMLSLFEMLLARVPDHRVLADLHCTQAACLASMGKSESALKDYEAALRFLKNSPDALIEIRARCGLVLIADRQVEAHLVRARQLAGDLVESAQRRSLGDVMLAEAVYRLRQGCFAEAEQLAQQAVELYQSNPGSARRALRATLLRAEVLFFQAGQTKSWDNSFAAYSEVVAIANDVEKRLPPDGDRDGTSKAGRLQAIAAGVLRGCEAEKAAAPTVFWKEIESTIKRWYENGAAEGLLLQLASRLVRHGAYNIAAELFQRALLLVEQETSSERLTEAVTVCFHVGWLAEQRGALNVAAYWLIMSRRLTLRVRSSASNQIRGTIDGWLRRNESSLLLFLSENAVDLIKDLLQSIPTSDPSQDRWAELMALPEMPTDRTP